MIVIRTAEEMARALDSPLEPTLKDRLQAHWDRLSEWDDYELSELAVFLIAQPRAAFAGTMQYTAARDAAYVHPTKDRWNVTVPVAVGYAALQARVVRR